MILHQPDRLVHWVRNPVTTRHSQTTLLVVSLSWGLSYCMPEDLRIPFSEVFPPDLDRWSSVPMWGYGVALFVAALSALVGERLILGAQHGASKTGWRLSYLSHSVLCATYFTLTVAAAVTGAMQCHGTAPGIISAVSRPVLWSYIGYLHLTYARLPRPDYPERPRGKRRRRLKMVYVDDAAEAPDDG